MANKSYAVQQTATDDAKTIHGNANTLVEGGGLHLGAGNNLGNSLGNIGAGATVNIGDATLGSELASSVKDLVGNLAQNNTNLLTSLAGKVTDPGAQRTGLIVAGIVALLLLLAFIRRK